jgi:hypothetical protein
MIQRRKKIVLYQPKQVDESLGLPSSKDMLPLEMLAISAFPLEEGYEVVIVDGSLHDGESGHARLVEACDGAMLYGTTGILGYMVVDGWLATEKVKARFPDLPAVIGGWFASVRPDLQLETGLYDAVAHGQGEHTFMDIVRAVDAGEPLDSVPVTRSAIQWTKTCAPPSPSEDTKARRVPSGDQRGIDSLALPPTRGR